MQHPGDQSGKPEDQLKFRIAHFESRIWDCAVIRGDDEKRFIVRAEVKLTAFLELESVIRCATIF
jgi:hypothetical protein